jgi:biopolymer transport protein ExbB
MVSKINKLNWINMRQHKYLTLIILPMLGLLSFGILNGSIDESLTAPMDASEAYFDIVKVFQSCPLIYSLLIVLSVTSLSIWLYSMITLRVSEMMPKEFVNKLNNLFSEKKYDNALALCKSEHNYISTILAAGISARKHGAQFMIEAMNAEGKRLGLALWQRISLLNEIAIVAPMVGLLGTVVGLFFAFYDSARSAETITSIFDGLGIAVGTTVVGLIVSILAMIFYTTLKFRVVNLLNTIENETLTLATQVEIDTPLKNYNS